MGRGGRTVVAAVLACLPAACAADAGGLTVAGLRCEWLVDPVGVVAREPRLSWRLESAARDQRQSAAWILVATDPRLLEAGRADLWDSGRLDSAETLGIPYAGRPLTSGQRAYWRVRSYDGSGAASPWSDVATWTMGILDPADWRGAWITAASDVPLHTDRATLHLPPARNYRKTFALDKPVRRAVLHGTALGLVDWSLDGRRVSDDLFQPGWTDYRRRVPSRTIDVTPLLATGSAGPGPHCLGATVADGWYAGYVGYGLFVGYGPHRTGRTIYGVTPALMGQLDVEYEDGSRDSIVTDTSWQVTDSGPVREADFLMGEAYDATRELPGWDTAAFVADEAVWRPAVTAASRGAVPVPFFEAGVERQVDLGFAAPPIIDGYAAPPIRVTEELPAKSVTQSQPGVWIFDLGQNFAGVARLKLSAPAGTRIQLRFGEMLHPDGRLMTENLRRARATDSYVCKGGGVETWAPRFTYHGFQFVEVSGLPAGSPPPLDTITGLVLHNATPPTGRFACSDPVLTRLWRNTTWTQRANFVEVPTDCPQRDERLGWMGDAQIYVRTATFNADVAAFFTKWIADVREAQLGDGDHAGAYPDYAPYPFAHGKPGARFGTAWSDAGVIVPWTMWRVYGDTRLVARHWESMERFMDWRLRLDPRREGVEAGNPWGDWLNLGEHTPIPFIDLCHHAQSARMMAEMAEALGRAEAAATYRRRFAELAESFRGRFVAADGRLTVDTQTACVLALEMGLVPPERAAPVVARLVGRIEANGFRMATGFLGTKSLLPALSAHGHHDLACRLFQSRKFPSWGYEVEQGANTIWERWDGFTKEHGFEGEARGNNAAMNSFSHYAFGAVMEWAFRTLAGIDALEPGYGRILIRPRIPTRSSNPDGTPLEWVQAEYESPRGAIASHWRRQGDAIEMEVRIPPNTRALVHVPARAVADVQEGGRSLAAGPVAGVRLVGVEDGAVVLDVGSGSYRFTATTPPAPPHDSKGGATRPDSTSTRSIRAPSQVEPSADERRRA